MSEYEKTSTPNMVIDKSTGAVLNNDMGAYAAVKAARLERRRQSELVERVMRLEQQVAELRELLLSRNAGDTRD